MTITRKFRSVGWVAAVSAAALSCYLISYRVSAERGALEDVEREIAAMREDIHSLNTEFETRSRLAQIERWNRRDFVLAAPTPDQVLESEIALASLLDATGRDSGRVLLAAFEPLDADSGRRGAEPPARQTDVELAAAETGGRAMLQPATYLVPEDETAELRAERVALLDEELRGEIASLARSETEVRSED